MGGGPNVKNPATSSEGYSLVSESESWEGSRQLDTRELKFLGNSPACIRLVVGSNVGPKGGRSRGQEEGTTFWEKRGGKNDNGVHPLL